MVPVRYLKKEKEKAAVFFLTLLYFLCPSFLLFFVCSLYKETYRLLLLVERDSKCLDSNLN